MWTSPESLRRPHVASPAHRSPASLDDEMFIASFLADRRSCGSRGPGGGCMPHPETLHACEIFATS